jgi:hypothetical protein
MLSDPVQFTRSIRAGIEHGGVNDETVDIESVAHYYKVATASSAITDEVNVGEQTDHGYTWTGTSTVSTKSSSYEGDDDIVVISDTGRVADPGVSISFTVAISPANVGVSIRRRMDFSLPQQQARVFVDNVDAGIWYDPAANTTKHWRDSEFLIPPALTRNKSSINIRLENISPNRQWTDFHYWIQSLTTVAPNDDDADDVLNGQDNCRSVWNPDQADSDGDEVGDACDSCPDTLSGLVVGTDGCPLPVPGDMDSDGDVDQEDFGAMQNCLTGPFNPQNDSACQKARLDEDSDVDTDDVLIFINCLTGPGIPGNAACAN